jgi:Major Facilitator Superfamily
LFLGAVLDAHSRSFESLCRVYADRKGVALAGAAVIIAAFVFWERHSEHPMLPMRFFGNRRYSVAIASLALVLFALLGMFFLMTQYLQFCLGFSPLGTGLAIGPIALVLLVVAPSSVLAVRRFGTRPVVSCGLLLIAVGLGLLSRTTVHNTYLDAFPLFVLMGIGVGLTMAPSTESIMGSVPKEEAGVGSATSDTSMQVGGALGVGVLGTALNFRYQNFMTPLLTHVQIPEGVKQLVPGSVGGSSGRGPARPRRLRRRTDGSRDQGFHIGHGHRPRHRVRDSGGGGSPRAGLSSESGLSSVGARHLTKSL